MTEPIARDDVTARLIAVAEFPDGREPERWGLVDEAAVETLLARYADAGLDPTLHLFRRVATRRRPPALPEMPGAVPAGLAPHTLADELRPPGSLADPAFEALMEWAAAHDHNLLTGMGEFAGRYRCGCGLPMRSRAEWVAHLRAVRA